MEPTENTWREKKWTKRITKHIKTFISTTVCFFLWACNRQSLSCLEAFGRRVQKRLLTKSVKHYWSLKRANFGLFLYCKTNLPYSHFNLVLKFIHDRQPVLTFSFFLQLVPFSVVNKNNNLFTCLICALSNHKSIIRTAKLKCIFD